MRRLIFLIAVLSLLLVAGCGDDDETSTPAGTSGATGAQDSSNGDFSTAKEFIDGSLPDQIEEVQTIVGITPDCEGVDAKPGGAFQQSVAINAAQAQPGTPIEDIVADQCGGG